MNQSLDDFASTLSNSGASGHSFIESAWYSHTASYISPNSGNNVGNLNQSGFNGNVIGETVGTSGATISRREFYQTIQAAMGGNHMPFLAGSHGIPARQNGRVGTFQMAPGGALVHSVNLNTLDIEEWMINFPQGQTITQITQNMKISTIV
jgi:hypothetical protein